MRIDDVQKKVFADTVRRHHSIIPDIMDGAAFEEGGEEKE